MHSGNIRISALLRCYTAYSGNFLTDVSGRLSVPTSGVKKSSTCVELLLDYIVDGPRIELWRRWDFPHPSRPALGPTQLPASRR